jgi:hypothetical protein
MLHKLALVVLLPVMLMNGLWMACYPSDQADSSAPSKESADCIRICAALEASLGTICLLFPGHTNASITVVDYGAAILPQEILLQPAAVDTKFERELVVLYGNPFLAGPTHPPRA